MELFDNFTAVLWVVSWLTYLIWLFFYLLWMVIFFLPFIVSKRKTASVLLVNMIFAPTIIWWLIQLLYEIFRGWNNSSQNYQNNSYYSSKQNWSSNYF